MCARACEPCLRGRARVRVRACMRACIWVLYTLIQPLNPVFTINPNTYLRDFSGAKEAGDNERIGEARRDEQKRQKEQKIARRHAAEEKVKDEDGVRELDDVVRSRVPAVNWLQE
jgi:hypothetical protein